MSSEVGNQKPEAGKNRWRLLWAIPALGIVYVLLWIIANRTNRTCPEGFTLHDDKGYRFCNTDISAEAHPALLRRLGLEGISQCQVMRWPITGYHINYQLDQKIHLLAFPNVIDWIRGDAYVMRFDECFN